MENKEIHIRIQDIFASCLKSIVCVAAVTVAFGAIFGAYGFYKARHTTVSGSYASKVAIKESEVSDKELAISNLEKANTTIRDVEIPYAESRIEKELIMTQEGKEYVDNSIFYSMDPLNCGTAKISFAIDAPVPENVTEDIATYKDNELRRVSNLCASACPFSDDVMKKVADILKIDVDLQYVEELIYITNYANVYCRLDVYYPDAELAKKAADYLFGELTKIIEGYNPEYKLSVISEYCGYEVNWAIYDDHSKTSDKIILAEKNLSMDMDSIDTMNQKIDENNNNLAVARSELDALNAELLKAKSNMENAVQSQSAKRNVIKYGLIGAIFGFILSCVYVYVKYLLGGKIRNRNTIIGRYNYPLLGVVPSTKKRFFDKTIKKLEGDPIYTNEDIISAIAANTLAIASVEGSTGNCLVGTIDPNDPSLTALKEALGEKVKYAGNILSEANAVKELESYSHVVLVEKRNESAVDSLTEEITKIKSLKKEIVGIILL